MADTSNMTSMSKQGPFESIESAHEFMTLLEQVVNETLDRLQPQLEGSDKGRSADGLRLAIYKLNQLQQHVHKSRRILNDLEMIERVLMGHEPA